MPDPYATIADADTGLQERLSEDGCPRNHRGAVIGFGGSTKGVMSLLHDGLPPLIVPNVDQHPNEPGFLSGGAEGHGLRGDWLAAHTYLDERRGQNDGHEASRVPGRM